MCDFFTFQHCERQWVLHNIRLGLSFPYNQYECNAVLNGDTLAFRECIPHGLCERDSLCLWDFVAFQHCERQWVLHNIRLRLSFPDKQYECNSVLNGDTFTLSECIPHFLIHVFCVKVR